MFAEQQLADHPCLFMELKLDMGSLQYELNYEQYRMHACK